MISVGEVVINPDTVQTLTVRRSTGAFVNGVWKSQPTEIPVKGTVNAASSRELKMIPEGDMVQGALIFHADQMLFTTRLNPGPPGQTGISDKIVFNGIEYKILSVTRAGYGYWRAFAVRMSTGA